MSDTTNNCKAVNDLLINDAPDQFSETLDELWEAWLCSNAADGTNAEQRYVKLMHTKALKKFLAEI